MRGPGQRADLSHVGAPTSAPLLSPGYVARTVQVHGRIGRHGLAHATSVLGRNQTDVMNVRGGRSGMLRSAALTSAVLPVVYSL